MTPKPRWLHHKYRFDNTPPVFADNREDLTDFEKETFETVDVRVKTSRAEEALREAVEAFEKAGHDGKDPKGVLMDTRRWSWVDALASSVYDTDPDNLAGFEIVAVKSAVRLTEPIYGNERKLYELETGEGSP